jgi:hypothetical protein
MHKEPIKPGGRTFSGEQVYRGLLIALPVSLVCWAASIATYLYA